MPHVNANLAVWQVIFCTIAKSSSSEWRRLLLRVHDDQTVIDGRPAWCGTPGNLLRSPTAPPLVRSLHHFHELKRTGYRSAVWLRDPYERAGSIYTGTAHLPRRGLPFGRKIYLLTYLRHRAPQRRGAILGLDDL